MVKSDKMLLITKCVFGAFIVISLSVADEDISGDDDSSPEAGRDLQKDFNQNWRAVDYFSPSPDTSSWIPQPEEAPEEPKRRRIRKRKRRPPTISLTNDDDASERKRPLMREPWEEMSEESEQKPYIRRRLTPVFDDTDYERVRDPFTALLEAEEKQKKAPEEATSPSATPDLKALLKQTSGGLSLSEVLQQKNLSLAELLMGNRQAISALVQHETTTEISEGVTEKYKRLPPSIGLRNKDVIDRNFHRSEEMSEEGVGLTSDEIVEAQRKRLSLLHGHGDSKLFTDVTKFDVVTEETTEKRVFVPSGSKLYGMDLQYQNEEAARDATTAAETTTAHPVQVSFRPRPVLPLTSAKLNKLVTTSAPVDQLTPKAIPININEIFGFGAIEQKNNTDDDDNNDTPLKMTIDLIPEVGSTSTPEDASEENVITSTKRMDLDAKSSDKMKHVTAKDEIMQILQDPVDREHLSRILRSRNMTVQQLVEQRERGSSQLHLADIFHNKTREPEPKEEPFVIGHIGSDEYFNSFPLFSRKPKSRPVDSDAIELATRPQEYTITSFPTFKIELTKNTLKEKPAFPGAWKELYPGLFNQRNNQHKNKEEQLLSVPSTTQASTTTSSTTPPLPKVIYEDLLRLEDLDNNLSEAANGKLNIELHQNLYEDEDDEPFISLPSGVKSAILASLAVIGLSLLVFVTILVIFKWTQWQKRKLNYAGSFSGSRIKSPILENCQRRSIKTIMSETLGRKKNNYYKSHMQSMSDSIWDSDEKKSYMI